MLNATGGQSSSTFPYPCGYKKLLTAIHTSNTSSVETDGVQIKNKEACSMELHHDDQNELIEPYQEEKESKYRWLVLALAFLSVVLTFIDRVNLSAAAPGMMKEFKWSPAVMGIVLSTFAWTYMLAQIPGGFLVDRFGLKKVFGWSFTFWGVISMLTATVRGVFSLSLWRGLLGLSEAPLYPGLVRLLFIWFKNNDRAFAMTIIGVGLNVGLAVGAKLSTTIVHYYGWRIMFIFTGLISLIIVPIWVFLYRELSSLSKSKTVSKAVEKPGERLKWYHLLKERNVLALTIGYFGSNYGLYLFITWLPSYFVKQWHFSLIKSGTFTAVVFLAGLIGKPFLGWLSGHLIRRGWSVTASRKTMLASLILLGTSIGIVAIAPNPILAAVLLTVSETTSQASGAICWATAADIAPKRLAAQMGGVLNLAAGLAGIMAPIVTGFILAATGSFHWPLLVAAIVMVISAVSYVFVLGKVEPIDLKYVNAAP